MKKILGLTIAALLVMALVGGGTWAYFSDVETAAGNTFTAGTLNLQVGAADPATVAIAIGDDEDCAPGDSGNAADWDVENLGNLSGTLKVTFDSTITNNENTITEPETADGDITDPAGELGGNVKIAMWLDADEDGTWSTNDEYLPSSGGALVIYASPGLPTAAYDYIDNFSATEWDSTDGMPTLAALGGLDFMVDWDFATNETNDDSAQGDSCVFDIIFTLEQVP